MNYTCVRSRGTMNTSIIVKRETRDELKQMGLKGQTYDQVINELMRLKRSSQKPLQSSKSFKSIGGFHE